MSCHSLSFLAHPQVRPLIATQHCYMDTTGLSKVMTKAHKYKAENEFWQLWLNLVHRCFVWLIQCFQRVEPTFNNWKILHEKCRFLASLKKIKRSDNIRSEFPHGSGEVKLTSSCPFEKGTCSALLQLTTVPTTPYCS